MTAKKSKPALKAETPVQFTGPTLTAERLCQITRMTDRHNRRIAAQGYFPSPIQGIYQAGPTLLGFIKYLQDEKAKGDDPTRVEQRAFLKAKRELAEAELAQFRGKFAEIAQIAPALRNVSLHQRAVLVRKLEQELPGKLVGLTTIEILALMRSTVDELIMIFREGTKAWCEGPPA